MILRILGSVIGLTLLLAGGVGFALTMGSGGTPSELAEKLLAAVAPLAGVKAAVLAKWLGGTLRFALAGVGTVVMIASLWRRRGGSEAVEEFASTEAEPALPKKLARKVRRQAASLAKKGQLSDAAELCFCSGLLDAAADYFEKAEEWVRAAELRHDEEDFERSAELYIKAGHHETAAAVFAAQDQPLRAAECYEQIGRMSVAGELYEQAERHAKAGACFAACEFHRHAAQAFVRAKEWQSAAASLEQVILEEGTKVGTGQSPEKEKELRKLVLQAGKLYEQAGDLEAAERVLEKGGAYAAAAEIALRLEHHAKAAELFAEAKQPERAAEVLDLMGETQAAARIRGEHLRESGDDTEAAAQLIAAGDFLAAGDVYRRLEAFGKAAECYEQEGDAAQAAEMFRTDGDHGRAAESYGRFGQWEEAAECYALAGDVPHEAEALAKAGRLLEAGQRYRDHGLDDEALSVLQQLDPGSSDFAAACAMLGAIFRGKGQHELARQKLERVLGNGEVARPTVDAHYELARVLEDAEEFGQAVAAYERILAFDYGYQDVEARLAALKPKAAAQVQAQAPPQSPAGADAGAGQPPRYQIAGELGRGGMGIVYKAQDTVLDRPVAFKVLPDALRENPQALKNFLREAKSAAKLNHPNIVTVYDAGEQEGRTYIAMEYVDGTTLKEILQRRGLIAPNGVLHVLMQMCEALGYAHEQRVVHRDIKTANTMWTRDKQAKIMDFGLAKVVEEVRNHTTLVSGTPYYMSPEQTLGKNIDHRTDIYSLGVTLYELATGTLPFTEGNVPYHHVHTPAPDPREANPELPTLLAKIIARCLQKDPAARFQTTREITALVKGAMARRKAPAGG